MILGWERCCAAPPPVPEVLHLHPHARDPVELSGRHRPRCFRFLTPASHASPGHSL